MLLHRTAVLGHLYFCAIMKSCFLCLLSYHFVFFLSDREVVQEGDGKRKGIFQRLKDALWKSEEEEPQVDQKEQSNRM